MLIKKYKFLLILIAVFGLILMWRLGNTSHHFPTSQEALSVDNTTDESLDYSDELRLFLNQCEKGNKDACDHATNTLYNFGDMSKVIAISKRMCDLAHGSYCTNLGTYYTDGIKGTAYDPQKGYRYYKQGCELGSKDGCEGLKQYSIIEDKIVHHAEAKIAKINADCEGGNLTSCIDLGYVYHHGIGASVDTEQAVKFYRKGCDTKELNMDRRCEGYYEIMEKN